MKSKLVISTLINFANLAFGFVISFIMTPIILHRIGNDQYGIWVFLGIFSISGYFSLLDMGMQGSAIKYIAEYHAKGDSKKLNEIINSVIFFFVSVGTVGGLLLLLLNNTVLFSFFNVPVQYQALVRILINMIAISFLFQFPAMGFSAIIEGLQRYDILRISGIVVSVFTSIITCLYLNFINGIWFLTVLSLLSSFAITAVYYFFSCMLLPEMRLNLFGFKLSALSGLFSMSWQLFVSRLCGLIFNNTDKIVIGIFLTMSAMTNYDIVNKIHIMMLMMMSVMNQAIVPFASRLDARDENDKLKVLFIKGTKYSVLVAVPAFIFLMVMCKEFISVWLGGEFADLYLLAMFYMSHCVLTMLTGVASTMMVGMNRVRTVLKVSVIMAIINLLISLLTVKYFGIWGLIGGTVVSFILGQMLYIKCFMEVFEMRVINFLKMVVVKPYSVAIIVASCLYIVKRCFVFSKLYQLFFVGVSVYFAFFIIYLFVDKDEMRIVSNFLKNLKARSI